MFLVLIYLFIAYLLVDCVRKNLKLYLNRGVGGPGFALPLLGHFHHFKKGGSIANLHEMSKKYGSVFKLFLGDNFAMVVSDPDTIHEIYVKNFEIFRNRSTSPLGYYVSGGYQNILGGRDEHWKKNKQLISKSFTSQKLKTLHNTMQKEASDMVDIMKEFEKTGEIFEPRHYLSVFSLNMILQYVFSEKIAYSDSIKDPRIEKLMDSFSERQKLMSVVFERSIRIIGYPMYYYRKLFQTPPSYKMKPFVRELLQKHVETIDVSNPRDLLDDLILDNMSVEQIQKRDIGAAGEAIIDKLLYLTADLIIAGSATTADTMEWMFIYLANYPEVQEKVHAELTSVGATKANLSDEKTILQFRSSTPYLRAVIKEVMRIRPAVPSSGTRECAQDVTVNGIFVPKGTTIFPMQYTMFSSEANFEDPEHFNPNRFLLDNNAPKPIFSPFGWGIRNCVGKQLADDELYLLTASISLNFKISSIDGKKIDDTKNFKFTLYPTKYPLKVESRN